jgi:hypothetical protein
MISLLFFYSLYFFWFAFEVERAPTIENDDFPNLL